MQHLRTNQIEPNSTPEHMSCYTVNVSAFEKVMEREFNSYLKNMSRLGLLAVSVKACKSAIASGIAVDCVSKKAAGRPKKVVRDATEDDIIADLTAKAERSPKKKAKLTDEEKAAKSAAKAAAKAAKAEEKAAKRSKEKAAKAEEKAAAKAAKDLLKKKLAEEKKEKKRLEKEAKELAKATAKAAKVLAANKAKEEKKEKKRLEKEAKAKAKAALKEKKASKAKAELERKSKEAKALQDQFKLTNKNLEEESYEDEDIKDETGEIVGNKVSSFEVPPSPNEIKRQKLIAAGLKPFTHNSKPEDELYIDNENSVWCFDGHDANHIGEFNPSVGTLTLTEDDDSDSEMEELSDTE